MVVELLVLGTLVSDKRPFGKRQIGARGIEVFIDQKVFLFPAEESGHFMNVFIEIVAYFDGRCVKRFDGTDERCLVVECFAGVCDKYRRDTERVVNDKCRRRRIPRRIAASFESIAQSATRKTRRVRFLLGQQLAVELFYHAAFAVELYKCIVFFGCSVSQRLEPVRIMRDAFFERPHAHTGGNMTGYLAIDRLAAVDSVRQCLISLFGKVLLHCLPVKNVFAKIVGNFLSGCNDFYRLPV